MLMSQCPSALRESLFSVIPQKTRHLRICRLPGETFSKLRLSPSHISQLFDSSSDTSLEHDILVLPERIYLVPLAPSLKAFKCLDFAAELILTQCLKLLSGNNFNGFL